MTSHPIRRAAAKVLSITRSLESFPPLLARLALGVVFATTGWGKVHDLDKVTNFFTELHIPAPAFHAVFVSYIELVCGSLLVVGLASRVAAVPLVVSMIVAIVTAKADEIHGVADLFGTLEFTYAALLAWIAVSGPGRFSLDHLVRSLGPAFSFDPEPAPEAVRA